MSFSLFINASTVKIPNYHFKIADGKYWKINEKIKNPWKNQEKQLGNTMRRQKQKNFPIQ
jgi:hypothetical protein